MTNEEIARDYRLAKDKNAQVGILAELNGCRKEDIIDILIDEEAISGIKKKKEKPEKTKKADKAKNAVYYEKPEDKDIIRWYNEGMKMAEIAERLGLTFHVVQKRIENMKKVGIVEYRGKIKQGNKKIDIDVVDYEEDKVTTESSCDENSGNGSKEETIPQSAKLTAPFTQGSQDREIGSVHIHAGNVSIFISFK